MEQLKIHVRNRVIFARMTEEKKHQCTDYTLFDKNGVSIYIFRYERNTWNHVYGQLSDDVRDACIDALILRFDWQCTDLFYVDGERKIVDVSFAEGGDHWAVCVNRRWKGNIRLIESTMDLVYNEHNRCEALTTDRLEKYFRWIREGRIKGSKFGSSLSR